MTEAPRVVRVEEELWDVRRMWRDSLDHLASRFGRVHALDTSLLGDFDDPSVDLPRHIEFLDAWAGDAIDWRRELTRFFEERLPRYARPDPRMNQDLRAAARTQSIVFESALPQRAVESVLAHLGVLRIATEVRGDADQSTRRHITTCGPTVGMSNTPPSTTNPSRL